MSYVHAFFIHTFFSFFLFWTCVSILSFSLSFSDRLRHGTQTGHIYSSSEPSLRFKVIFFFYSSYTLSYSIPWWEGQDELHWELPSLWCSSETPNHSIGFLWHYATRCHSNSRMGISLWETRVLSCCVYSGVLVQHTWNRYLCASVCIYI